MQYSTENHSDEKRKLGAKETIYSLLHDKCHAMLTIVVAFGITGKINHSLIITTLHLLFLRHPSLRTIIIREDKNYYLDLTAEFNDIPINIVTRKNKTHWKRVIEETIDNPLETKKYLWRFTLLIPEHTKEECECVVQIHHAISDGLSLSHFTHEFLDYYSRLINGETIQFRETMTLPPIENLLNQDSYEPHYRGEKSPFAQASPFYYHRNVPKGYRKTKNIYVVLNEDFQQSMIEHCRKHHTTVNAAFNATMLLSAQRMAKKAITTNLVSALNLRKYSHVSLSTENIGCYIAFVVTPHENINKKSDFWALAKDYKEKITNNIYHAIKFVLDVKDYNEQELAALLQLDKSFKRDQFLVAYSVTNKGLLPYPDFYKNIKLSFYYDCASQQAGNVAITLFVTTLGNKSFLTFTYPSPLIKKAWAQKFVKNYIAILRRHCTNLKQQNLVQKIKRVLFREIA